MSVVVKLDMSKVPADYISNNSKINTNGTTIKKTEPTSIQKISGSKKE